MTKRMKDRILSKIFSIVLLVLPIVLAAQPSQVLQDIDRQVTFPDTDFRAIYTMVTENPGVRTTSKSYIVLRRDSTNRYLVRIQEPAADRGKAYLLLGEVLYAYDPGPPARFESTSNQDRFESSSLRLSDFTQSNLASEYSILSTHTERLGAYITEVYDLEATRPSTTFQRRKIW